MASDICNSDAGTRVKISDELYLKIAPHVLQEFLQLDFRSERQREVFTRILPHMWDGSEWTAYSLFQEMAADPVTAGVVTHPQNMLRFLDIFAKMGLLEKSEGDVKTFSLDKEHLERFGTFSQILQDAVYRGLLETHYAQIYILICIVAREIAELYPDEGEERIFGLTQALITIGVTVASKDLITRHIIRNQCNDCYYPYRSNAPHNKVAAVAQRQHTEALEAEASEGGTEDRSLKT
jgi:hypothetical protein